MKKEFEHEYDVLAKNIRFYRRTKGYTIRQMSEKVGVDATHLSRVETCKTGMSLDVLFAYSKVLGVKAGKFFEDRNYMEV